MHDCALDNLNISIITCDNVQVTEEDSNEPESIRLLVYYDCANMSSCNEVSCSICWCINKCRCRILLSMTTSVPKRRKL